MNAARAHYDTFLAPLYTWMSGGHDVQVPRNREWFAQHGFVARAGDMALDLGCGSGYQSLALAQLGFEIVAVDTNRHLLGELRAKDVDCNVTTVEGDMFEAASYAHFAPFDAVVCMGDSLLYTESVSRVGRALADVYAHMNAGGRLVLSFRDLSTELQGVDRAIPVRLDEHAVMTTFLEFDPRHVLVTDMLLSRVDGCWEMTKGAYRKLRLSGREIETLLVSAGFSDVIIEPAGPFTAAIAVKPSA